MQIARLPDAANVMTDCPKTGSNGFDPKKTASVTDPGSYNTFISCGEGDGQYLPHHKSDDDKTNRHEKAHSNAHFPVTSHGCLRPIR
jgi:hypothetical protein